MAVEFRILGEVEAYSDGRRLDIGHARQRCVLVCLLVDVNRPISTDQLINRVWADDPPYKARNALAAYISRLRQLLATDDVEIVRGPAGYVLRADPMSIDLHRFRHLASAARACANSGEATVLFNEALDLWRGKPFELIDAPWANGVREALELDRLSVMLDRNDVALDAGRHFDVLAELTTALDQHSLDERMAGQLMLAQYRSGRQADALDTYRAMRERLVEQLGVDPSPSLQAVHRQILDGDLTHPIKQPTTASRDAHSRGGLPRRTTRLIGRDDDTVRVGAALTNGSLVTLTGVGGVGKTVLALEVAGRNQSRFADGAWFCELAPLDDGAAVGHAVAASLRLQEKAGVGIEGTVIEFLRARQVLLVIDNCEHVLDACAHLVERITRECPQVCVLATSRRPLALAGEQVIPVDTLPGGPAAELFAERAKASRPDFDLDKEPVGAVAEICRRVDGLPLAIELAAARMRVMNSLEVARRLDRLRLLSGGARSAHPRQQSLAATIDWSYRLLDEDEQSLFARLSIFAGGFDLAAAHAVCGADGAAEDDTLELLIGLVDKSMVTVRSGADRTRYGILETLREYGRQRLRENGRDTEYALRHAVYFAELGERAAVGMHGADEKAWVERTLPDYDNFRVAFDRAMLDGDVDVALRLIASSAELIHLRVGYESADWAQRVLPLAKPDHRLYAAAVGLAARGAWNRGDYPRSRALAALAEGRAPGAGSGRVAYPADVLADVAMYEGDVASVLAYYTSELERARGDSDPVRLVWTLYYVAICHALLHTPHAGLPFAEESVRVADATANPTAQSMARYALGQVLKKADPQRAQALFDEAAELAASVQNFGWHGLALREAAAIRAVHADPATAARIFVEVLNIWDRVGDWSNQWPSLQYVAKLLVRLGAGDDARALHRVLVDAGKASPTILAQMATVPQDPDDVLTAAAAVARARTALLRYF
ncbi:AfsR/SARP family transcriptional regulator [Mycolicibacterium holsaticum]|uniref:Transcriptional regulator n=1 Tax=Mycolicibacterium holsaticum TaxID=152142 RepID=A0A1E3RU52_9MYCO|nr:BTAD domain-containing putative transcriptional regulator [Mycolicibacterium holsaticum]ODQ92907.1 transcriptional regulator [Mycolicibacterium holsaticum]